MDKALSRKSPSRGSQQIVSIAQFGSIYARLFMIKNQAHRWHQILSIVFAPETAMDKTWCDLHAALRHHATRPGAWMAPDFVYRVFSKNDGHSKVQSTCCLFVIPKNSGTDGIRFCPSCFLQKRWRTLGEIYTLLLASFRYLNTVLLQTSPHCKQGICLL